MDGILVGYEAVGRSASNSDIPVHFFDGLDDPPSPDFINGLRSGGKAQIRELKRKHRLHQLHDSSDIIFRIVDVAVAFSRAAEALYRSFGTSIQEYKRIADTPYHVQEVQKPEYGVISCSDSRVAGFRLLPGNGGNFTHKTVAGNIADSANPAEMDGSAQTFFAYGIQHLGIRKIIILTHGPCGGVANAVAHYNQFTDGTAPKSIYQNAADAMRHPVDLVKQHGIGHFRTLMPTDMLLPETHPQAFKQAVEIAHAMHSRKVARTFVARLKQRTPELVSKPIQIISGHFDFHAETGFNLAVYQPDRHQFELVMQAPSFDPLPLRDCCAAPAKASKRGLVCDRPQ